MLFYASLIAATVSYKKMFLTDPQTYQCHVTSFCSTKPVPIKYFENISDRHFPDQFEEEEELVYEILQNEDKDRDLFPAAELVLRLGGVASKALAEKMHKYLSFHNLTW